MEDLNFRSMSRRDLQALCKKHCIPANSTNAVMADRLTALFSEKENEGLRPVGPSCLKGSGGSGGLQGDGYCTRSKRKRVTFQLAEGDRNLEEDGGRNDPDWEDSPELAAAAVPAPRVTRSRSLRLEGDTETALLRSDVGRTRRGGEARTLNHPNVDGISATAVRQLYHDGRVDERLMALRHGLQGVVTHADAAPRRSRRLRDPGLTEETGVVAAAAPSAVPVPEVQENIKVGSRRGSRKHNQDPMLVLPTFPQGSAPAAENVARGESGTGGRPRRSKRNHPIPEFTNAGGGASEISAAEIPDVGVEAEKVGSAAILDRHRHSRIKSARFRSKEIGDVVHKDADGDKLQRQTRKNAPERADEGISALACESKNCHGASSNAKKSDVSQGGEHLGRSKRNVRKKSVIDILPTDGINSEDDYGKFSGAVLPAKVNIKTTRRGSSFARENGKLTGSLEFQENSTKVSDYDEPTKRKRRISVKCGVVEQKISLRQSKKRGNDRDLMENKCSWETKSQRSDNDSPETFSFSDSAFDGNVVMGDAEDSAEASQLGQITNEAKYQGSEDISRQEEMADGVVQEFGGELGPTESLLATYVPLEKPKAGAEPDRRGIQHEEHDKPEEVINKIELESFKDDSQVNYMGSPAVARKSLSSSDQGQKEDLPGFPPSNMKDTVDHSHAYGKASTRESCGTEPDRREIQHEEHDKPEEVIKKIELESFKDDSQVNYMGSPAVARKSHSSSDQGQKEDLPFFPPSNMKDTVEHSHANGKTSIRESCDVEVHCSSKEISDKASCSYQCPAEDVGPSEKPDCAQLSEHEIDDSEGKTSTDMMEIQPSPGLSSVSGAYNRGCNVTIEITAVGDDAPLSNSFKGTRIEDVTNSSLVDDQGSESHDYLLPDLMTGNKNSEAPAEASETTLSSADAFTTGGKLSPGSDGMDAFSTQGVLYVLDDEGCELNGNSLPSPSIRNGDETAPDEAVAANLPRTLLMEKECESSSSDGSQPNDHAVDFAEADDPCGSHEFSNASEVAQELTCDVDPKENIEVDFNGNFSGRSFSLFVASEKTANVGDKTEGRQRNKEISALRRLSTLDIAPLDIASTPSNCKVSGRLVDHNTGDLHTGIELLDSQKEAGCITEGTSSGPKSLEKNIFLQTEDKYVLTQSDEILTDEDDAIKFSDTTVFSAEKQLKLDEHEVTMEARAYMHDEVLEIGTSTQMKSKEVEVAMDLKRSRETFMNSDSKEGSFDNNREEAVEATLDAHECVISRKKFANNVADIDVVEGELATDYSVTFSGYKKVATPAVHGLERQTKLQNEESLVTQEAKDGSVQESLCRDLASGGQFTVPTPPHPTPFEEGVELADIQETGRSVEASDDVVGQLDRELSSSRGVSSELLTVSSDVAVASLSNHKPLCETYNLSSIVEDRTEPADLLVNMSSVEEGRPVLNETAKQLLNKIVYNEESPEDNENSPINIEESAYMGSYRTTERKPCGVGLNKHRETVELIKDAVGRAELSGTEVSGWMLNTVAEGENAHQSTLEVEKEIETTGDQLGHIHALSAVKTPEVQGTNPDGKCTAGADESSFQIGKLLHDESVIPPIWPTNGGNMKLSTKVPESSSLETECDVCEIKKTEACLSYNDGDKDRFLGLSQLTDVNSASSEILKFSPIIQVIRPDSRTDYRVMQAKERAIEHNSGEETGFTVLCMENRHDFIDPSGNEKEDEKTDGGVSEHNPSYETYPEVLQTQKSAGNHDFTAYNDNEQDHNHTSRDILEHTPSYETCPEFLQTGNAVGGHDFVDNVENVKEVWKLDGDVSENNSGHETCLGDRQTENSVGGHGFINLSEDEKEGNMPNRDMPEHKSNDVTYSVGMRTETVCCHNFVDHGGIELDNDQTKRCVSEEGLSSEPEEKSVQEKRDNGNDKLTVVTHGELISVEHEVKQLKGEIPDQVSSSFYQSEVYETVNLMSANDCKDHKELGNDEDNRSMLPEELEHNAQHEHLLQQNKDTMGQGGLFLCFEPKILADGGSCDENLKYDIRNCTAGSAMIFAELDDNKHEDALSNRHSSTSDDNYFPHVEAPAVEIPTGEIQITLTQIPDIGENLARVPGSWGLKNMVKDMNHEEVAGTVQDQEAVEMWTEEPETQQHKEALQNVNCFDNPYCQDTKDGLTYSKEHEAVESYSGEAHNLGNVVNLEATKDSESSNWLEDASRECNDLCASVFCKTNEHDQEQSICKSTGAYARGDQGEVGEFYRNRQRLEEMHLLGMEIDRNDDEEKLQLASFEELAVFTDTVVGNNDDYGEQPLVSMNPTSANILGESDSACGTPLDIGNAENGALVNDFSYAAVLDGTNQTPPDVDSADEIFPDSAIPSEVEHFALDATCLDDKHDSAKETTMIVANEMNTLNLHNVEEGDCFSKKDGATTTGDWSGCLDVVARLAEEEEINDIFSGLRISSARNHTITGSCTPRRNQSSKIFLQIEGGKENTPFSKNTFVEKSTVHILQNPKRKALANLQNITHSD